MVRPHHAADCLANPRSLSMCLLGKTTSLSPHSAHQTNFEPILCNQCAPVRKMPWLATQCTTCHARARLPQLAQYMWISGGLPLRSETDTTTAGQRVTSYQQVVSSGAMQALQTSLLADACAHHLEQKQAHNRIVWSRKRMNLCCRYHAGAPARM